MAGTHSSFDEEGLRERFRTLRETGDERLRDQIIVEHAWIARTVARRFDQRGEAYDDLVQVASLGLVKAADASIASSTVSTLIWRWAAISATLGEWRSSC